MKKLRENTYYLFFLPLFFVLHAFVENFGSITIGEALLPAILYIAAVWLVSLLFRYWLRSKTKAGIITLIPAFFFFFYPALHDFLLRHSFTAFAASYRFLLPAFLIFFLFCFVYIGKSAKHHYAFTLFLNVVFFAFFITDLGKLALMSLFSDQHRISVARIEGFKNPACDTCHKPDIFLIILDEYAGSASLRRQYNFENGLDSFLREKHFSIQTKSRSNYNYTVFSMASLLNMDFLRGIPQPTVVTARQHGNCIRLVRHNAVTKRLKDLGYDFLNYSVFSIDDQPTNAEQTFVTTGAELITGRTIMAQLRKEWQQGRERTGAGNSLRIAELKPYLASNREFQKKMLQNAVPQQKPRFIYAHFMMPHLPFYFDRYGHLNDLTQASVISPANNPEFTGKYLEYVLYVNSRVREMVSTIQTQNPGAVILLLGDHGFRPDEEARPAAFENLNAVYYPDRDYTHLYDSISSVNLFRVVFNKYFEESLPLLPDSTVFIRNRH